MSQAVTFSKALPDSYSLEGYKKHFSDFHDWLSRSFSQHPVNTLVKERAKFIDHVLVQLWQIIIANWQCQNIKICQKN